MPRFFCAHTEYQVSCYAFRARSRPAAIVAQACPTNDCGQADRSPRNRDKGKDIHTTLRIMANEGAQTRLACTFTDDFIRNPFGGYPGFISLMQSFRRASGAQRARS